jgi:hypothetical protein
MLGETIVRGKNMERALSPGMINKNSLTSIKVNGHFVDHLGGILEVVATILLSSSESLCNFSSI